MSTTPALRASRVRFALVAAFVAVALGAGCSNAPSAPSAPSAPGADALLGRWTTTREPLRPAGSYQSHLTFTAGGRFVAESRLYGGYGLGAEELSSYSRTVGTWATAGSRLAFAPDSLVTWDRFYGAQSPETIQAPYPYTGFYDDTRFRVRNDTLRLDYTTYPADAAVPTTQHFRRER